MHIENFKKSQVRNMLTHGERKRDENGDLYTHSNIDLDPSRTHLNYSIGKTDDDAYERYKEIMKNSSLYVNGRSDQNLLASTVVQLPPPLKGLWLKNGMIKEGCEEDVRHFFTVAYQFFYDNYVIDNDDINSFVGCYVHLDETSPHFHFYNVPIVENDNRNKDDYPYKVSFRDLYPERSYFNLHDRMEEYLDQDPMLHQIRLDHGWDAFGMKKSDKGTKNYKAMKELKQETRKQEVDARNTIETYRKVELEQIDNDIAYKKSRSDALDDVIAKKTNDINALNDDIAEKTAQKKSLDHDITTKTNDINTLNREITTKTNEIKSLDHDIVSKQSQIGRLNHEYDDRKHDLDKEIGLKSNAIKALDHDIAKKTAQKESLDCDINDLNEEKSRLQKLIDNMNSKIKKIRMVGDDYLARIVYSVMEIFGFGSIDELEEDLEQKMYENEDDLYL